MFQDFKVQSDRSQSAERLKDLRQQLTQCKLDAFLIPVADAFQSSVIAPHDQRVAWLTGFTGSAGICAVTGESAALSVDGRYTLQASAQIDDSELSILNAKTDQLADWLMQTLPNGGRIGFDPWLHSSKSIKDLRNAMPEHSLVSSENLVDRIWADQPALPQNGFYEHPESYAGESRKSKIQRMSQKLIGERIDFCILSSSDDVAWLLNIRGSDTARTPVKQAMAILSAKQTVELFLNLQPSEFENYSWLGDFVTTSPMTRLSSTIRGIRGRIGVSPSAPYRIFSELGRSDCEVIERPSPCAEAKSQKNETQVRGFREAHLRDGLAMIEFLAWLDHAAVRSPISEIDAASKLEQFRHRSSQMVDISFDTISAAGPNASIVHYRVNEQSNSNLTPGQLYLVDSGAQYRDGTTDITRTIAIGQSERRIAELYTLILRGLIALSSARWPTGLGGKSLDALARQFLWREGLDFAHATGHGVGHFLSVHEGPVNISARSDIPLTDGMILSIEPGYYESGSFGIRLENLVRVRKSSGSKSAMLEFETLSLAPFDRSLILCETLSAHEISWLNSYHSRIYDKLHNKCSNTGRQWLSEACAPLV